MDDFRDLREKVMAWIHATGSVTSGVGVRGFSGRWFATCAVKTFDTCRGIDLKEQLNPAGLFP